jgi:hypothetical protein
MKQSQKRTNDSSNSPSSSSPVSSPEKKKQRTQALESSYREFVLKLSSNAIYMFIFYCFIKGQEIISLHLQINK